MRYRSIAPVAILLLGVISIFIVQEEASATKGRHILGFHTFQALVADQPPKNPSLTNLTAGKPVTITGTSMHPNATAANCIVDFQINDQGYNRAIAQGPPDARYMNWTFTTTPLHAGINFLEAQLTCFKPGFQEGTAPVLVKHLTHNITASAMTTTGIGVPAPSNNNNKASPPLLH